MFQFSAWLPIIRNPEEVGQARIKLDDNLGTWIDHFNNVDLRWEIRKNYRGQVALFREGKDATSMSKFRG